MAERTAADVQREIEQARASLAVTVDQLADRTSPRRIASNAKQRLVARAQTPQGKAVLAAAGALVVIVFIRGLRRRHQD